MLSKATDLFVQAIRGYEEERKAQYTDKGEVKNYFRASELGSGDRKIIYGFFKHQIPTTPKSAKNLRQLANGDKVHERYQKWWDDMGALVSMEQRLSSKDDEYLKQYDWEWAGHYDAELDINVLRAHALGLCTINYVKNEETEEWAIEVDVADEYANKVGLFEENYEPLTMVADIKTMNPWGFKRIKDKGSLEEIQGYIDQISFYMYMLNTPYGSIFIEDKGSNETIEVQIVWTDMHEGVEYAFDPEIHGESVDGVIRTTIDNERFFGSEKVLGVVPRIDHLWTVKKLLEEADANNTPETLVETMPPRCSEDPGSFPCSWGGGKEKCEYFDHCWNQVTGGCAVRAYEACPAECKFELVNKETGEVLIVDTRKLPSGVTTEALKALYDMGAIDVTKFLVVEDTSKPVKEAEETAMNADHLFGADGALNLGAPAPASTPASNTNEGGEGNTGEKAPIGTEAIEYVNADNKKAIKCLNCGKELTYARLANGGTKKCEYCNHVNKVIKA